MIATIHEKLRVSHDIARTTDPGELALLEAYRSDVAKRLNDTPIEQIIDVYNDEEAAIITTIGKATAIVMELKEMLTAYHQAVELIKTERGEE